MEEIPLVEAIRIIDQLDRGWDRTQWEMKSRNGKLVSADDLDSFVPDGTWGHARTILEPTSGRLRLEAEYTAPWIHGPAPFGTTRTAFAFDGQTLRKWNIIRPGSELPEEGRKGVGEIGLEHADLLSEVEWTSGHGCFPPFFVGYRLSKELKKLHDAGKYAQVFKRRDGSWEIRCWDFTFDDPDLPDTFQVHIGYDPTKNGVINGAVWHQPLSEKYKTPPIRKRMYVDLQQLADGAWAPQRVRIVTVYERVLNEKVFNNVVRNPPVTAATFRISFPRGIRVTDQIHQKMYTVGSGLENDQRAVQAFMKQFQLREQASRGRRWPWLLMLAGLGLVAASGLVFVVLRGRVIGHLT